MLPDPESFDEDMFQSKEDQEYVIISVTSMKLPAKDPEKIKGEEEGTIGETL